ncbi:MAG: error-prone DNA polymerase [Acidimicrobiales bacterium]|nr:error-prone DNA polymerase [Acidimicrobiales bacterium]
MGWSNPPVPWAELERRLSDRSVAPPPAADGGDSPAWGYHRSTYQPPPGLVARSAPGGVRYAELHCHSHYSFLDGASSPGELAEEAARLGLTALALTDHDGFYGAVQFREAAGALHLPTVFGAELSLDLTRSQAGRADPEGRHVVVLARGPEGYRRLCRAISEGQLAGGEKGRPIYDTERLAEAGRGEWLWLTGCRKGAVPGALVEQGPAAARRELLRLVELAGGTDHVGVELWDHGHPLDSARNDALAEMAAGVGVECVATNNVHYHSPARHRLAAAMAAVRARRSLDDIDGWLPAAPTAHLRSGVEQAKWFRRFPGVVERAAEWGLDCAFDLLLMAPKLPRFPCPDGMNETGYLRHLVAEGALDRYGLDGSETREKVDARLSHELSVIEGLGWPGYFLIVWDLVRFCTERHIYCQGRGSAVGSAVCYALGITSIDPVETGLLFERFLSTERGKEPPDIDLDIESDRREEVIQYAYQRYGRDCAAQVANVITYRARSSVRDMAKALGYAVGQQDAWAKQVERGPLPAPGADTIPAPVLELAGQLAYAPRHLGIHSGGMVLADRPIAEVCPIEWARREQRTVLQWEKDDCALMGLVKIDLLGLGMLSAIHYTIDLVNQVHGMNLALHTIPADNPAVYDMICAADAIGVFQIESRAQMQTLPRMRPRCLYDLAIQIAIIRPGPIQGGSVHPFLHRRDQMRRNGEEKISYPHPSLEPILEKTLGVPLFQDQLMRIATEVGGFSAGQADELRRAMGSKRSRQRMAALKDQLYEGMAARGITGEVADQLWAKLAAFSDYGFPESHALAFAHLAYASAWLKRWYPAAFCAGLLNAQPMGFYSPHSLVLDARRHGVTVATPDLNSSEPQASLETTSRQPSPAAPVDQPSERWGLGGPRLRLGLASIRTLGSDHARRIVDERRQHGPYRSMEDLARRVPSLTLAQLEALATAGAFGCLGLNRRPALWSAGAVTQARPDRLPGIIAGGSSPQLPAMSERQVAHADLWATGISPDGHPTRFVRAHLDALGVTPNNRLADLPPDGKVLVAGIVTHRQRPATASGMVFLNLEDETGMTNIICSPGFWARYRQIAQTSPALIIRGRLQSTHGVINIIAEHIEALRLIAPNRSRDFR